ncbi:MAG: hypothetical protein IJG51_10155 [Synergistaceae bacterium]|nr:hypothetical protein [Synergistaceae bacterium]MBQ3346048.1 hypothetical protein [Synergistaceae bacterium]MBQ3399239.1 hypothetical protein [Synergistaceae bacterium]MBQ3757871.1 hypothetical protein [Synergistaceae bacterium]MBQ6115656.1 hypothetical protein [Synergistaceae bacterium]
MRGRILDYPGRKEYYEGIRDGKRKISFEIARKMRDARMDCTMILQFTGLTPEDLNTL